MGVPSPTPITPPGIKARVVNNATELLKFTAPSNITFIESAINNVRLTRDGMVIMSFNDSTDVTIMGTGFFNNTGRYAHWLCAGYVLVMMNGAWCGCIYTPQTHTAK